MAKFLYFAFVTLLLLSVCDASYRGPLDPFALYEALLYKIENLQDETATLQRELKHANSTIEQLEGNIQRLELSLKELESLKIDDTQRLASKLDDLKLYVKKTVLKEAKAIRKLEAKLKNKQLRNPEVAKSTYEKLTYSIITSSDVAQATGPSVWQKLPRLFSLHRN